MFQISHWGSFFPIFEFIINNTKSSKLEQAHWTSIKLVHAKFLLKIIWFFFTWSAHSIMILTGRCTAWNLWKHLSTGVVHTWLPFSSHPWIPTPITLKPGEAKWCYNFLLMDYWVWLRDKWLGYHLEETASLFWILQTLFVRPFFSVIILNIFSKEKKTLGRSPHF